MKLLEEIEAANNRASIRTFDYCTIQEFQLIMDKYTYLDFPAHIIDPMNMPFTFISPRRKMVVPINGWILRRIEEDTNNYRTKKLETEYMEPMRQLVWKFMKELIKSEMVDSEVDSISGEVRTQSAYLNAHLFGIPYVINLPIVQSIC